MSKAPRVPFDDQLFDPVAVFRQRRRDLRNSVLIGLCCLLVYNANFRAISTGDTYPARYLPFAIWKHHSLLLDRIAPITAQGRAGTAYWMLQSPEGHAISLYPVTLPLLIAPLYLPAVAALQLRGWTNSRLDWAARAMEKSCASLLAALSASLLYLLLRRRAGARVAMILTVACAFGTTTWVISSQALWQHGMAQLLVIGALLLLTGPCTTWTAAGAGLLLGLVAANRPPDALIAAALGAYGLVWAGRRAGTLIAASALPMALLLLYNLGATGRVAGAYALVGDSTLFHHDLGSGLAGLLFSPTRGLFVFSPFLLFLALVPRYWRRGGDERFLRERALTLAIVAAVVLQLLLYAKFDWRGGISWGPRFLTDLLPLLVWMLVPVVVALRGFLRVCFVITVIAGIAIEAIGAFYYTGATDQAIYAVASGPDRLRPAWEWRNAPFIASLKSGRAPAELLFYVRGNLEDLHAGGRPNAAVTAGEEVVASGWALAGGVSPWRIGLMVDGRLVATSESFHERLDVPGPPQQSKRLGWEIRLDTSGLAPGEHTVAAMVWLSHRGDAYYLGERRLTVRAPEAAGSVDLRRAFQTASERVRENQQPPGYWLTWFTSGTRFERARPEMNVYLTAVMVDLLDPIEGPAGLEQTLRHARQHLTAQIEPGGLVRYHGLPDAPGIGTLGCAITPDTDDTALVWRVAPPGDRSRLASALATIDQYRGADGIHLSWLAPIGEYQCLNPGADPNPPDIVMEMHLLLLLSKEQPAAARALCSALRPVADDERMWAYYRLTPLVAMLRLPDMARAGCALELPESRMRTAIAGQEIWVSVVRLLSQTMEPATEGRPVAADKAEIGVLLRTLAANDFALLRANPPLLYHNDLTASVSRYYWSEDSGYALWLRLAHEYDQLH